MLALAACGPSGPGGPGGGPPTPDPPVAAVHLEPVVSGLQTPVAMTNAGDERLFVAEREGRVRVVEGNELQSEPYLDIADRVVVEDQGEGGLLGIAFPEDHATSGSLYAYYTGESGSGVLSRFTADPPGATSVDPATEEVLISFTSSDTYHYGGQLAFGPDRYLYWAVGDGGNGDDAQDLGSIRGKLLRLDVSTATGYAVPSDNPFVEEAGAEELVWAYGLRNPWRFSFDDGRIFIADVGEEAFEELNVVPAGSAGGGQNFGWPIMEGPDCFGSDTCDREGLTLPVLHYPHEGSASITGGYVYRGGAAPDLVGHYVFADFMRGDVYTASAAGGWQIGDLLSAEFMIASLGVGSDGQLYVADFGGGGLYELVQ